MIPCYIQNRDVMIVKTMVEKLSSCDDARPVVMDCGSTYPPLLDWMREAERNGIEIVRVNPSYRNRAAFTRPRSDSDVYLATDSDLDITELPSDFLPVMREILLSDPLLMKVGSALRIDDLPAEAPLAERAAAHEARFWSDPIDSLSVPAYMAEIDTTLAVYRDGRGWEGYGPSIRLAGPFAVKHVPWYITAETLTDDWRWYLRNIEQVSSLGWTPLLREFLKELEGTDA